MLFENKGLPEMRSTDEKSNEHVLHVYSVCLCAVPPLIFTTAL